MLLDDVRSSGVLTFLGFIGVEVTVSDDSHRLGSLNSKDTNNRLRSILATFLILHSTVALLTCTISRKKLRLKSRPDRTYLFETVMRMEAKQYARIGAEGLFAMLVEGADGGVLDAWIGSKFWLFSFIS